MTAPKRYLGDMKIKTSVTLSEELLGQVDRLLGDEGSRSAILDEALREYLANRTRRKREADDLEILNRRADLLNEEALDVLGYQVDL